MYDSNIFWAVTFSGSEPQLGNRGPSEIVVWFTLAVVSLMKSLGTAIPLLVLPRKNSLALKLPVSKFFPGSTPTSLCVGLRHWHWISTSLNSYKLIQFNQARPSISWRRKVSLDKALNLSAGVLNCESRVCDEDCQNQSYQVEISKIYHICYHDGKFSTSSFQAPNRLRNSPNWEKYMVYTSNLKCLHYKIWYQFSISVNSYIYSRECVNPRANFYI